MVSLLELQKSETLNGSLIGVERMAPGHAHVANQHRESRVDDGGEEAKEGRD